MLHVVSSKRERCPQVLLGEARIGIQYIGKRMAGSKLAQAEKLGVPVIDEAGLRDLLA